MAVNRALQSTRRANTRPRQRLNYAAPDARRALAAYLLAPGAVSAQSGETLDLTDAQMEALVRRSCQYVAMLNVNNKFALEPNNPMTTGGYNRIFANTELVDHTLQAIARPNNDTLYTIALYENETGFFIPNDRFKYSVGENAGFKLGDDGGIRIVIAAEQPEGVPEENWLPINRKDMDLDIIMPSGRADRRRGDRRRAG